ncbi:hypothetical protein SAMN04489761_4331 [Tenacibaculum sp. MAR_2009_124]|uniref:hypothetical protein n=1 Tax=Tenacibaculum sp. MAR_2009_124 TaxID=1250059 RepID=UPI0008985DBB|nr:hypothetical protein [Tenacibaculum sp. MAR_2009_124]SED11920.1 hypothetical protein SAMN04489761_4331 [Tenacibaculum sp. MAR_2009_124]
MPTETKGMTIARAENKEIKQVNDLLNELESIGRYNRGEEVIDVIKEDNEFFKVLSSLDHSDPETLLRDICNYVDGIRHQCVMFNLTTLMDNCADLNKDTLDFNPELKRGLELVELEKEGKLKLL